MAFSSKYIIVVENCIGILLFDVTINDELTHLFFLFKSSVMYVIHKKNNISIVRKYIRLVYFY